MRSNCNDQPVGSAYAQARKVFQRSALACLVLAITFILPKPASAQLMLNAPWPAAQADLTNDGGYPGPGSNGQLRWTLATGNEGMVGGPIISANNTVYIVSGSGALRAIDGALGTLKWTFQASAGTRCTPAISEKDYVYFGDGQGDFYAIDGATGAQIWTYTTPTTDSIEGSPTIGPDNTVYFGTKGGSIFAVNGTTGAFVWSYQTTPGPVAGTAAIDANGTLYYGSWDKYLYALNTATGTLKWKFFANDPISSSAVIGTDGTIYFNTVLGLIYALDSNGNQIWMQNLESDDISSGSSLGIDRSQLYYGSGQGYLVALSKTNGSENWSVHTGAAVETSPIVEENGRIIVGNFGGTIEEVERLTGETDWSYTTPAQAETTPLAIAADGAIFFGDSTSVTYSLDGARISKAYLSPLEVTGGVATEAVIQLTQEAGAKGEVVAVTSPYADLSFASPQTVPAGKTGVWFQIATSPVSTKQTQTLSAELADGTITSFEVKLDPAVLSNFYASPTSVIGGVSTTGVVQLTAKAGASGDAVSITGGNSVASAAATVTVPAGTTGHSFQITTTPVSASTQATLTATFGSTTKNAVITVNPAPLSNFYTMPSSTSGGTSVSGVVQLSGKAGQSGNSVSLQSSSASAVVPASVTVAAGSTGKSFTITTSPVSVSANVTLTAVSVATVHFILTLNPYPISHFYASPSSVVGGIKTHGVLQLTGPAGPSGDVVSLKSNSASATVPATVTVPAGSTGVSFTIVTSAVSSNTSVTLTATLGSSTQQTTLTVTP